MILYAIKINHEYLHDEKDGSFSRTGLKGASVYDSRDSAKEAACQIEGARVVRLCLTETELPD